MLRLRRICNRISRSGGVRLCVSSSGRCVYRVYCYLSDLDTWCFLRSFRSVADCEEYLRSYERP